MNEQWSGAGKPGNRQGDGGGAVGDRPRAATGPLPLDWLIATSDHHMMTTDRLGIDVLETNTCLELLRSNEVGRLAVAIANHPDIFPINYVVDHASVVFRTAEGTKLAAAVLGESVAFEVGPESRHALFRGQEARAPSGAVPDEEAFFDEPPQA